MRVRVEIEDMKRLIEVAGEVANFSPAGVSECMYEVGDNFIVNDGKEIFALVEVD